MTTHVVSDPPGARIIIDGNYMGEAPLDVRLYGPYFNGMSIWKALPKETGCTQSEMFMYGQLVPRNVFFDTNLCKSSPSVDVNVHQ